MSASINFQAVFDASPNPLILIAQDFKVVHVNAAALAMLGRQLSDVAGRHVRDVFPDATGDHNGHAWETFCEVFKHVLATQRHGALPVVRYALQRTTRRGLVRDERFWTGSLTPILEKGKLACISYNLVDVTEAELLKRNMRDAELLRASQGATQLTPTEKEWQRLRHLLDQVPGFVIFVREPQHILEMANESAYQILGHRPLIGRPVREAIPEMEAQGFVDLMDQAYRTGHPVVRYRVPVHVERYSGAPLAQIYVDFVYQPITDTNGAVTGIFIQGHDVTEQVHAQEELRIREDRWKSALEASGAAVWDYNPQNGDIVYSDNWKAMLGYEESVGTKIDAWEQLVHPEDFPRVLAEVLACRDGMTPALSTEYRMRRKDGSWIWILTRGAVVSRDHRGRASRVIGTNVDVSDKKQSEHEIWLRANFDQLTGLPNRSLFHDRLHHEIEHARRTGGPIALLFIDLDRFKEANDWLGHSSGDLLLQQAADRIRNSVRKSDTVARLGGDEFTVILTELDTAPHVEQIAHKILQELAQPFQVRDKLVEVSGSIGITLFPADADNPEDLIKHADQAMYVAKNSGRNQFSFFTRSMQEMAAARRALFGELRDAVREQQLQLLLQPIVSLHDGCITKAEALVRWMHPYKGLLAPTEFISLAEETGLIHEIGDWVFLEGANLARRLYEACGRTIQISINKSPVQFMAHAKGIDWTSFLRQAGMAGKSISVEITEGLLLNASESVAQELLQLRDAGVQVAIDDFGTGYSSMAYLKKFDVDYLKIDQSFVRDTEDDISARTIAETIIVMAHKLGLKVIAEGVETAEQRDWLKNAGCDYAQGYLFSRPVTPGEFERMVNERGMLQ